MRRRPTFNEGVNLFLELSAVSGTHRRFRGAQCYGGRRRYHRCWSSVVQIASMSGRRVSSRRNDPGPRTELLGLRSWQIAVPTRSVKSPPRLLEVSGGRGSVSDGRRGLTPQATIDYDRPLRRRPRNVQLTYLAAADPQHCRGCPSGRGAVSTPSPHVFALDGKTALRPGIFFRTGLVAGPKQVAQRRRLDATQMRSAQREPGPLRGHSWRTPPTADPRATNIATRRKAARLGEHPAAVAAACSSVAVAALASRWRQDRRSLRCATSVSWWHRLRVRTIHTAAPHTRSSIIP